MKNLINVSTHCNLRLICGLAILLSLANPTLLLHSEVVFICQSPLIPKGGILLLHQQKEVEIIGKLFQEVLTSNSSREAVCIVDFLVFAIMKDRYFVTLKWYHITIILTV